MNGTKKIRTRFAPSPTGFLHVGGLRTALFAYLWAKKNGGDFLLRIEDTDRERLVPGAEKYIIDTLQEFGLVPNETSRQSDRLALYKKYAGELVKSGKASEEKTEKGTAVRFHLLKTGVTEWQDAVYGKMQFKNDEIKDPIILKSDGYPVYNFANVIDDHDMGITHVMRGEEFLSSTPIHIQLYRTFGWDLPQFVHLPLILDRERKKLSKRSGDVMVEEYLKKGYLKPALLNFIALLGWNPKTTEEVFSLGELEKEFDITKINKAGAIFDIRKLDFIDRQWRKRLGLKYDDDPLFLRTQTLLAPFGEQKDVRRMLELIYPQILERISGPSDLEDRLAEFHFYFKEPEYDAGLLLWKKLTPVQVKANLQKLKEFLSGLKSGDFTTATLETNLKAFITGQGMATGEALWPLRVALSGQKNSPGPFEILAVFAQLPQGVKTALDRIDEAVSLLSEISEG